jgi:hypothetical protein
MISASPSGADRIVGLVSAQATESEVPSFPEICPSV